MNSKKIIALLLVLILAVSMLAGCGGSSSEEASTEVRIAIQPSAAFVPLYITKEKGWIEEALKEQGITVVWNEFESGPPINESMAAGSSDIACLGDVPSVSALASGQENVLFASACEAPDSYHMLVRSDSDIQSAADLKGKKVGTVVGSTGHVLTEKLLKTVDMELSDVEIVNITVGDAQVVLENKEVDAVAIWEPNVTKIKQGGTIKTLATGNDCGLLGVNPLVARAAYAEANPDVLKVIIEQYARGVAELENLDQETVDAVAKALSIDSGLFYTVTEAYNYIVTVSDEADTALQETIEFLVGIDVISEDFDVTEYIDKTYCENADIAQYLE